jgi:hypothetical protein
MIDKVHLETKNTWHVVAEHVVCRTNDCGALGRSNFLLNVQP